MMKIAIVNGPNLNLTGVRQTHIYGSQTFEDFTSSLREKYKNVEFIYLQSNVEGELINFLHELNNQSDLFGILLNAGAYTHTSIAIADAVAGIQKPVLEIHLSNILNRETYRHTSYLGAACVGSIIGLGMSSYTLGVEYFINLKKD